MSYIYVILVFIPLNSKAFVAELINCKNVNLESASSKLAGVLKNSL